MDERQIERKLVDAVKAIGGICPKWVSPGFNGVPDRIVLLPTGRIGFVEVKSPGKKSRPLQAARRRLLERLGFLIFTLDSVEDIDFVLNKIGGDAQ